MTSRPQRNALLLLAALLGLWACSPPVENPDVRPDDATRPDATDDTSTPADVPADGRPCTTNAECTNDVYCDGEERCAGGVCVPGRNPCDDGRTCTMDACDEATRMCTNAPDDSMCADPNACNGRERCNPSAPGALPSGCEPVRPDNVVDCDDMNTCTIDSCDPAAGCLHAPRDLDGDGHVDRTCTLDGTPTGPVGDDCNDGDERVYPGAAEICNDSRDNNCDGRTDYADSSCLPTNDTCASATMLPGPGTYSGSTVGLRDDYPLSCNTTGQADAAFVFTLASAQDVTVSVSGGTSTSAAVALVSDCGPPPTEVRCNRATGDPFGGGTTSPSLRVRGLMPGTYRILVETGSPPSAFRLTLRFDPPTTTPAEDVCPPAGAVMPAVELTSGVTRTAALSTLENDHTLSCNEFGAGGRDAVYRITLTAPSDVLVTVTPPGGGRFSETFVSFRNSPCGALASERRCQSSFDSTPVRISQRALPAGTYWVVVENGEDADLQVRADITTPPAARPPEDRCPTAGTTPAVELNDGLPHVARLITLEDDYELSCNAFGDPLRDGVFRLTTTTVQDVRITATAGFGSTALSFRNAACATTASERRCVGGRGMSASVLERSLPPGTYWVVVENDSDADVTVTAALTAPAPVVTYTSTLSPPGVSFVDICAAAGSTRILTTVDDSNVPLPMTAVPFPVRFYGNLLANPITVSSNGWLSLDPAPGFPSLSGTVPSEDEPNLTMALFWTDLYTRSTGVCYGVTGTAPNRRFVVQWQDVHFCCSDDPSVHLTFEAIINEQATTAGNNFVDFVYQTLDGVTRTGGAGIENEDGTVGTIVPLPLTAPRVIRFTPSR